MYSSNPTIIEPNDESDLNNGIIASFRLICWFWLVVANPSLINILKSLYHEIYLDGSFSASSFNNLNTLFVNKSFNLFNNWESWAVSLLTFNGNESQSTIPLTNLNHLGNNSAHFSLINTLLLYRCNSVSIWDDPNVSECELGIYKRLVNSIGKSVLKCALYLYGLLLFDIYS